MSDLTTIETKVHNALADYLKTQVPGDIFSYNTSLVFSLSESNVQSVTAVLVNDVELGSGSYSFDSDTEKVTLTGSYTVGDTIEIRYTYYNYSTNEINSAIRAALFHLSNNQYYTFSEVSGEIYPDPEENEENLIAMIAAIIINPPVRILRLPDINIDYAEKMSTQEKIAYTIANFQRSKKGRFDIA